MAHPAYQIDDGGPSVQPQCGSPASKLDAIRNQWLGFIVRSRLGLPCVGLITVAVLAMGLLSCDPLGAMDGGQLRGSPKAVHVAVLPSFLTNDPVNEYLRNASVHGREDPARLIAWLGSALQSVTQANDSDEPESRAWLPHEVGELLSQSVEVPRSVLQSYVGTYRGMGSTPVVFSLERGNLIGRDTSGETIIQMIPMSHSRFVDRQLRGREYMFVSGGRYDLEILDGEVMRHYLLGCIHTNHLPPRVGGPGI
ncbi:MAG: hypothetical protein QGI68_18190 [Pseudomonadales bacterium]|jgi:hypothetical protein|nr:hypothetical protein [Pseudomonadales bacterium]HJN49214.1 hypothetical protein [Pseudomonadales bacterium]